MSNHMSFSRAGFFIMFINSMDDYYGNISSKLNIPPSLLQDPMRLIPLTEMTHYVLKLGNLVNDELFVAKSGSKLDFACFPILNNIVGSSRDLFTAMMRFNSLFENFQTDTDIIPRTSGKIYKWRYNTRAIDGDARLNDGIFACWTLIYIMRLYHGSSYSPTIIHLPGNSLGKPGEMESIFSCDITWNAKDAQVWFPVENLKKLKPTGLKLFSRGMISQNELLSFVDMPNPNDLLRCVYELINYSRAFGYPTLEHVASLMGISPQKLQRELQVKEINFSNLVQHQLLCNQALKMMSLSYSYKQVAESLGFTNQQSFIKAFKRMHGLTPRQYQEQLEM